VGQEAKYQLPDDELLRLVKAEQRADYGINQAVEPLMEDVQRWPRAIPQYDIHQQTAAKALTQAAIPSFHIAANWLGGISLSDCIRKGRALGQSLE
jgi:oxygen-dependent protoporphyrinogen oxidase